MTVSEDIITPDEKEGIFELRERVLKDLDDDLYDNMGMFLRFLRARDHNLNNAEIMLRNHLQWRKNINIDYITNEYKPLEVLNEYYAYNFLGFDKEGSIILYIPMGNYDSRAVPLCTTENDWVKRLVKMIELDERLAREQECNKDKILVPGYFFIIDMKNLSFSSATNKKSIELIIKLSTIFQDNSPENLKKLVFINSSSFFTLAFSIVKRFLAAKIIKKTSVFGTGGYEEELRKYIDDEVLPAFLGGKRTDPDGNPNCENSIRFCGPVPEKYFFKNNTSRKSLSQDPQAKKLVLSRASFSEISLEVKVPDSLIEWEFETKSKDIAFGVFFKDSKDVDKVTELVPLTRLEAELQETGMYKCDKSGTYILLFDNSYSWIRSKEIYYKVRIVSPKEHEAAMEN